MTTTEALRNGAGTLAETAADAMGELAPKARSHTESVVGAAKDRLVEQKEPSHRGRRLLLGAALLGAAAAVARFLRRTSFGRQVEERVIDLTHHGDAERAAAQETFTA